MSAISGIVKGFQVVIDGTKIVSDVHKLVHANQDRSRRSISVAMRTLAYSAGLFVLAKSGETTNKTLAKVKHFEAGMLLCDATFNPVQEYLLSAERSWTGFFETVLAAPYAAVIRANTESAVFENRHLLTLPDEQRKVSFLNDDHHSIEQREISKAECQANIERAESAIPALNMIEIGLKLRVGSLVKSGFVGLYQKIIDDIARRQIDLQIAGNRLADIQLNNLSYIPEQLYDDQVFSRYECAITAAPIRDPVCDSNGVTLYERAAILSWIDIHHTSPITRSPLVAHQLLERPALRALIDARLQFHQQRIDNAMEQGLIAPAPPAEQAVADLENINY